MKRQMVERMKTVCSQVKEDNLQPLEETILRFVKNTSVVEACRTLGSVVKCSQVKATGDKTNFDLCSAALNSPLSSELVSCQLSPAAYPTIVFRCVVQQVTPGSFEVRYRPPTAGLHQLKVKVRGVNVYGTAFTVEVPPRKPRKTFEHLVDPYGLAVTQEGHLIVADDDSITIINTTDGEKIRSFGECGAGQKQFQGAQGVALTQDGHIVVADMDNNRLQVWTVEGVFVAAVGTEGSQPLQFNNPCDVAVHHNRKIFVADQSNYRVQVLNTDLTYSHCFGIKGNRPGEFDEPTGITIDSDGMVYVTDNNRVQKFTPEGEMLAVIDSKGEDQLNGPYGVHVDSNNILYVTEYDSNTVCMFSTSGQFLGYVGNSDGSSFDSPQYITSDQYGTLYISDENGVTVY